MRGCRSCALLVAPMICLGACANPDAPTERVDEIVIPMRPLEEGVVFGIAEVEDDDTGPRARIDTALALAVAEGYPNRFHAMLPQPIYTTCGMLEGNVTVRELSGGTDAVSAERTDTGAALTVHGEGTAELSLRADIMLTEPSACDLAVGTTIALDIGITVTAAEPVATAFRRPDGCDADVPLVAPSAMAGFRVTLVDGSGEHLHAANAAPEAQATLHLFGTFSAAHGEPTSLAEWIAPAAPGEVEIVPAFGAPWRVDVVEARAITAIDVDFQLAGAKGPMPLEPDGAYGESGWGADNNRIAPRVHEVRIGDDRLCSSPDPAWFRLESLTPEICEVLTLGPSDAKLESWAFYGASTGEAARLLQDGTCSLSLEAPDFTPGVGMPATLSATFDNVGDLMDW